MTARRRPARAAGLLVVGLYLAGALWSARLSPLAGRPVLDGIGPVEPYRWVCPPPSATATNQKPTAGRFEAAFHAGAIKGGAFATQDLQATVIVPHGAFAPSPGQRSVTLAVEPLCASSVGAIPSSLVALGNVMRIRATYAPSGAPARLAKPLEVVLVYAFAPTDSGQHLLLTSPDGRVWSREKATDRIANAQLLGPMGQLGYVAAAGIRGSPHASPSAGAPSGSDTITVVALVAAAILVLLALALVFGRRDRPRRRG
jgi:hypothetical protein